MKRVYERPLMYCEAFETQSVCAGCTANTDVTFDCMHGRYTDTTNVLSTDLSMSCKNNAGYVAAVDGTVTADGSYGYDSTHTTYNKALSWSGTSATAKNAMGMLYICVYDQSNGGGYGGGKSTPTTYYVTNHWTKTAGKIEHTSAVADHLEHVEIAPVFGDAASIATSW